MEAWKIIILFASCFLGGLGIFFFKKDNTQRLKLVLSFSGAYIFSITVLYLIPEVYRQGDPRIGLFVLAGFLFQILLEQFSEGIEHGHIHKHNHGHYAFPYGIMISLSVHALLEGMPLAKGYQNQLIFGIALHHLPASFALGSVLMENKVRKNAILILLFVFALMTPLGYFISDSIGNSSAGDINKYFDRMMGIVIGIFLHISTTILFESSVDHRFNMKKLVAVMGGVGIALGAFLLG
jgi:zinc transporter ZupT